MLERRRKERGLVRDQPRPLRGAVAGECSDPEAVLGPDTRKRPYPVDVHEVLDPRQAQCQERHEALPPGNDLGITTVLGQKGDGFFGSRRRVVLE
jgi:hypothetical protein